MSAPAVRRSSRRALWSWLALGGAFLILGLFAAILTTEQAFSTRAALDPDSPSPTGSLALARLLEEHGIDVVVVDTHDDVADALADGDATLALADAPALSDDTLSDLFDEAADVVLLDPSARTADLLIPGTRSAGFGRDTPVTPDCSLPDARRAGPIVVGRTFAAPAGDVVSCYPAAEGFGLLVAEHGSGRAVAVDGRGLFSNDELVSEGNAALGLNLLGRHDTLIWYVPSAGDTDIAAPPTLGELTPEWVTPAIAVLVLTAVAAMIWRGRRLGPLVFERLPVSVRVSETAHGRARLYARSRDHAHAALIFRTGTLARTAGVLGLGHSSVDEVADAVCAATGMDAVAVRGALRERTPRNDAELLALATDLDDIERAVRAAVHDEGTPPR